LLTALQRQYDRLEDERQKLIEKLRRMDPALLSHKPGAERWSILEEIQHLVLAEQKTSLNKEMKKPGEKNAEMLAMVRHVLDQDVVVDVPDPEMVPDGDAAIEDLFRDWEEARRHLYGFLESCGPDDIQALVSHHAVAGHLTVVECLRLITAHFNHHRRRIEAMAADF
jgi:hypothetical protein